MLSKSEWKPYDCLHKTPTKQTLRSGNNEFSHSDSCVIYLHRGSNAEAGRKPAEGFSGSHSWEDSEDQELGLGFDISQNPRISRIIRGRFAEGFAEAIHGEFCICGAPADLFHGLSKVWREPLHCTVSGPFMNSRIRGLLAFLHRGSNAEAGRKVAEEFSGRIHCLWGKC